MRRLLPFSTVLLILGCAGSSGTPTTDAVSGTGQPLADKVAVLERYVTFRQTYRELDFWIHFRNGGDGMVPSPSEWDVRLVAVVPSEELEAWIPQGVKPEAVAETEWLKDVPSWERANGVAEWYAKKDSDNRGKIVGVDRIRSVVAYRIWQR